MRERITMIFAMLVLMVMIPYLGTMALTGTIGMAAASVEELNTGKTVSLELDGQYVVMDVEAYLAGILPADMEGSDNLEVWKALAVIERTNIYKKMEGNGNIDEGDLEMRYLPEEERSEAWGERNYEAYRKVVEQAILETAGITIQYDGEYIDALYHKASVGSTVSAEELLGEAVPYLTAVVSSHDVESRDYMNIITISKDAVQELYVTESTEHGYVKTINCNGETLTGEEARERFQISSLNFYIEDMGTEFRIVSLGTGHGLGLSLYGAGIMAKEGKTYEEILSYFYSGIQLSEKSVN